MTECHLITVLEENEHTTNLQPFSKADIQSSSTRPSRSTTIAVSYNWKQYKY